MKKLLIAAAVLGTLGLAASCGGDKDKADDAGEKATEAAE